MAERADRWFVLACGAAALLGVVGWMVTAPVVGSRLQPVAQSPRLSPLLPYAAPLADSLAPAAMRADTSTSVVLRKDPFHAPFAAPAEPARSVPATMAAPQTSEVAQWRVTATLMAGDQRAAVINDALVHLGESLTDGTRLTTVDADRVVLTDSKGLRHTVPVKEGES